MVSLLTLFHLSIPGKEAPYHSFQTDLMHLPMRELPSLRESIIRNIIRSITRDQMSLSEEWMRKFTDLLLTLFHHSTPGKEAPFHLYQMDPMHLLMRVLLSLKEDIIRSQMSLNGEWTRKFMVSSLTLSHHLTPELEAPCLSFLTAQTHLLMMELHLWLRSQM